jgi:hypothetical protein
MRIEIAERSDGWSPSLHARRRHGRWQKQPGHRAHLALHDLTHFAVETSLGYSQAF